MTLRNPARRLIDMNSLGCLGAWRSWIPNMVMVAKLKTEGVVA
jgi:hypothetical protein